jgi:glycosyltransferase involved in cell wall biosynthesis
VRIAIVTETWQPSTDGVVTRLCATVSELCRLGHQVLILAPAGSEPRFASATVRGVATVRVPFVYGGKRWGLPTPQVARELREFAPDVVHVVNPILLGIAAVAAARYQRIPLVASYHTNIADYARHYHLGWLRPVIWWTLRTLHRQAAVNLATSAAACAQLRRRGIPRVGLWRRGVDVNLFGPHQRTQGPVPPGGRRVALYVGRVAAEKGLDSLAPLAATPTTEVVIVGDGPHRDNLRQRLPTARFAGLLRGDALARAYADADVFVFPSTTDTLGLVLLEALASGLPVVAADSPASREILGDCPAARLFPATDPHGLATAIDDLLASAPRADLAAAARRAAEPWGWAAATQQLLCYYRLATAVPRQRAALRTRRPAAGAPTPGAANVARDAR